MKLWLIIGILALVAMFAIAGVFTVKNFVKAETDTTKELTTIGCGCGENCACGCQGKCTEGSDCGCLKEGGSGCAAKTGGSCGCQK